MEGIRSFSFRHYSIIITMGLIIVLFTISSRNYLLFHTLVEGFSIVVAAHIFVLATKTYKYSQHNYLLFLGIAYIFVAVVDFLHTMTYKGMGVFQGLTADTPTQLWVAARFLEASALVLAPCFFSRKFSKYLIGGIFALVTALVTASILWLKIFPVCFVEGQGLTSFKIVSEFIICAILLGGFYGLLQQKSKFDAVVYRKIAAAIIVTILAELSFTLYQDVYGLMNFVGHILKLISVYLLYQGIVRTGIDEPFDLVFKRLKLTSVTDELTGLINRHGFYELAQTMALKVRREQGSMGILSMDIDNFKSVNDNYGHLFGDRVLKEFAELLRKMTRSQDILCRIGGDEFILITQADRSSVSAIRDRILNAVDIWMGSSPKLKEIGVSIGIAMWEAGKEEFNIDIIIEKADKEMYKMKSASGKHRAKLSTRT